MEHNVSKDQVTTLLDHGFFSSAQLLGGFLVSSTNANPDLTPQLKAESLVLLGDALFKEKEFRRAVVKFRIASSHSALNENRAALIEMEGIPSKVRTLQMNLMMAKLYRNTRHIRSAITCYKECLRQCPYIIEAITALAEMGTAAKDIISLFPQTPNRSGRPPLDHLESSRWLQRYVEAQCSIAANDYKVGLELFSELLQRFPNNVHLLLEMAKVEAITGKNDEAIIYFEKVRCIDPYAVTYMDEYALLLKSKSDHSKLNKLVHDLLSIDPTRPEVFVALSILWERKDDRGALSYAEKSIRIDERHVTGYIMKGNLLLSMNRPDAAVTAFRLAQEFRADIRSYQGLVRSYLALSKIKEALHSARQAMSAMPQSAKPLKLVGDVHASSTTGREKARKFYESALRLEPGYLGAALALAELHVMEGRNGDAVTLLERYLKDWADDSLHVKLAQVFAATNMLQDSLLHYQAALRMNPHNEAAKKGLERLEKQMKGVDPDAPEDDEENDVDDVDGDLEETELV
ncbi:OLC1v1020350C1 [Oldenlandia corymbosa var. corymbosa]|uniref:OLC1v1020350C1 n=1 Tax=Oldenlandia corymbosa var. corymbosa TaxID=529605 RepID=A0AAV1EG68_OLDCO|nr:OLC1v1020350C1 [Oldenlandia corymbosa var. corymbosa]